ncbi:MAG: ADP-glyceromanno-heptose 6-epimerase [Bacillota bacterium]
MYIVTGGAGFIGSNIVKGLNEKGINDILVVDNLSNSEKFLNLTDCRFVDYEDKNKFYQYIENGKFDGVKIEGISHQGACSNTMEYDGRYMVENNFTFSKQLFHFAIKKRTPFVYASSAAVYGMSEHFTEEPKNEKPANIYGYSKLMVDQYIGHFIKEAENTVVGLRYFNVYGPNEKHKGKMASVIYQFYNQLRSNGKVKLFGEYDGYKAGEQTRDFIYVKDIVRVNLALLTGPKRKGIYNLGTGRNRTFNEVAQELIKVMGFGEIEYIPFPEVLKGKYQSFTCADLTKLREAGVQEQFTAIEEGIADYYRNYLY